MKKIKGHFPLPSNPSTRPTRHNKTFRGKKFEKTYRFLKGSKDLLTPINGKSINWTPSEILRISLRGINDNDYMYSVAIVFFELAVIRL